jgi:predicted extracellular nuclease
MIKLIRLLFLAVFLPGVSSWALTITGNCGGLMLAVDPPPVQVRPLGSIKQLKIVTYNLENFRVAEPNDGPLQNSRGNIVNPKNPQQIADEVKIINTLDADIVTFEELYDFDALKVIDSTKYTPLMVLGNDKQRKIGFGVKSDLPFFVEMQTHETVTWNDKDAGNAQVPLYSRDLPVLLLRTAPDKNPAYIVVGNHGKSKRDRPNDKQSVDLRTAQYLQAQQIIKGYQQQFPNAVILMAGDFNADVRTDPEVEPIRQIMKSPFDVLNVPNDQRTTEIYFNNQEQSTYSQLDNIFVTANGAASVQSVRVVPYFDAQGQPKPYPQNFNERELNDSDHYPVELVINVGNQLSP